MIIKVNQVKTGGNLQWDCTSDNHEYCTISAPLENGRFNAFMFYEDGSCDSLYFNPKDTSNGARREDRYSFIFSQERIKTGKIVGKTQKGKGLFGGYPYIEFTINRKTINAYVVGFGGNGLFICIYDGERIVAIVEKKLTTIDFKDSYTAYIEESDNAKTILPIVIYYDMTTHGDLLEIAVKSIKAERVITPQKELREKYDSTYIDRVIKQSMTKGE